MDAKNEPKSLPDFSAAQKAWTSAQVLYRSPAWSGEPKARHVLEEITLSSEAESLFWTGLSSEFPLVVGYCLLGLELIGSTKLGILPAQLLDRRDKVTIREGSFSTSTDLGGLARQLKKKANLKSRL
jgi:hypothetical protein